jgi:hypothetical protein
MFVHYWNTFSQPCLDAKNALTIRIKKLGHKRSVKQAYIVTKPESISARIIGSVV